MRLTRSNLSWTTVFLSLASLVPAQSGVVRISGSTTVFGRIFEKDQPAIERASGAKVTVVANGSRQGLIDLAAGKSDIAMLSASIEELLPRLSAAERHDLDARAFVVSPLAVSRLGFIVHPSNPLRQLTLKQVSDIFKGATTNWRDVGGPDLKIEVVSNKFSSGQRALLEDEVLAKAPVVASAKLVVNDSQIPKVVRQLPGSIGHAAVGTDLSGVTLLKTDKEVVQPILLVTLGEPRGPIARVIDAAKKSATR